MSTVDAWDTLWINTTLVSMVEGSYNLIENAAIAVKHGKIAWVGAEKALTSQQKESAEKTIDAKRRLCIPALIDCHTHMVFAGNRVSEFAKRLSGATYVDIAKEGGGIKYTVAKTRAASLEMLYEKSKKHCQQWLENGVGTLEIKSGYGLDFETERKMLSVIKQLKDELPLTIKATYLGAHTVPPEYTDNADAYIDNLCNHDLPKLVEENLVDAVDVFCENIAFSLEQTERVFQAAKTYNLPIKCHAEQITDSGAAKLASQYGAVSVEHLEYLGKDDIPALKEANTVAVLLPGAFYFLNETQKPPVADLKEAGVRIAIATDFNPGSSPLCSLLLAMNLGCVKFGLLPEDALAAVTINAAHALGVQETKGTIEVGKDADFSFYECEHPDELAYYIGHMPLVQHVLKGNEIVS